MRADGPSPAQLEPFGDAVEGGQGRREDRQPAARPSNDGRGTDISAHALTRFVAAVVLEVITIRRSVGRAVALAWSPVRTVVGWIGRGMVWVAPIVRWVAWAAQVASRLLGPPLRALARRVGNVLAMAGQPVRRVARAAARVVSAVGRVGRRVARGIVSIAASLVGRPLVRLGRGVGRAVAPAAGALVRVLSRVDRLGRGVGRAVAPAVRALIRVLDRIGRLVSRGTRRAWAVMVGPLVWAARLLSPAVSRGAGALGRVVERAAETSRLAVASARRRAQVNSGATALWPVGPCERLPSRGPTKTGVGLGLSFTVDVHQNEYQPAGGSEIDAIITVTAARLADAVAAERADLVEVLLLDCSESMGHPSRKMAALRLAAKAAVDGLRDGVWFAIVRGSGSAEFAYPRSGEVVRASATTRLAAKAAIDDLEPDGGTSMGTWLTAADVVFAAVPDAIHHSILLTDGQNEGETSARFDAVLRGCEGYFQCDCRGVGTDWEVSELRKVASALLGTIDLIANAQDMVDDFRSTTERAMGRFMDQVSLRLWTPRTAEVLSFEQVSPAVVNMSSKGRAVGPSTCEYPTGAWGHESRDYRLRVKVAPAQLGSEMLAARIEVVFGTESLAYGLCRALWTDDEVEWARMDPFVAHFSDQVELSRTIQEGLEARRAGDDRTATAKLGRAVQLAAQSGNQPTLDLLEKVVDVSDAPTGTVRLIRRLADADEMALDTRSTKTVRVFPGR